MKRWMLFLILGLSCSPKVCATGEGGTTPAVQEQDTDLNGAGDEGEEKGIIPRQAETQRSTQTVTPISLFPDKPAYDQARAELAQAEALWAKGQGEAASDTALEAYDELVEVRRYSKKERKKLRAERRRAATIYVQAGIA